MAIFVNSINFLFFCCSIHFIRNNCVGTLAVLYFSSLHFCCCYSGWNAIKSISIITDHVVLCDHNTLYFNRNVLILNDVCFFRMRHLSSVHETPKITTLPRWYTPIHFSVISFNQNHDWFRFHLIPNFFFGT